MSYYNYGWSHHKTQAQLDQELAEARQRANYNLMQNRSKRALLINCPQQQ